MTLGKGVFNLVRDINIMVYILYEQDYVDVEFFCCFFSSRCVSNQCPLLESGTMGAKGHVQVRQHCVLYIP